MALLDSTMLYHGCTWGSTWLHCILQWIYWALYLDLLHSNLALHGSHWLYYILPWLYLAITTRFCLGSSWLSLTLKHSTVVILTTPHSTTLYHGSTYLYLTLLITTIGIFVTTTIGIPLQPCYTWLYLRVLHSTLALYCSTLVQSAMALLDSTMLYHGCTWGSTWLHCILQWIYWALYLDLLHSNLALHGSHWLYYILPWLYLAITTRFCLGSSWLSLTLKHSTVVILTTPHSTTLYHGSTYLYLTLLTTTFGIFVTTTVGIPLQDLVIATKCLPIL